MIKAEDELPLSVRDLAVKALAIRREKDEVQFYDMLLNFLNVAMLVQDSHRVDIECEYLLMRTTETTQCHLVVDGESIDAPIFIGSLLSDHILSNGVGDPVASMTAYYLEAEKHYDVVFVGELDHCSLRIVKEVYPGRSYAVSLRLPARVLIDQGIVLKSTPGTFPRIA
ncbi:hypothetical protein [uncultured Methanofollis sp.]|uniref:hypothetical protein n=1 Tax=uncultured Methanofollis sp. TaxID=262500 RepID=UPI0026040AA0|nr:hypothetical protein [uncultured Methanofollis sp.]